MAACLITVSGTSGRILLNYVISAVSYSTESGIGTFYIEDTATDVTYTTLSGDAIATSGCLTVDELPSICYTFSWETPAYDTSVFSDMLFNAIILGEDIIPIAETKFPYNKAGNFGNSINTAGDIRISSPAYKITAPVDVTTKVEYFTTIKVIGEDIPYARIKNSDASHYVYLKGEPSDCIPAGFTTILTCSDMSEL